VKAMPSPAGILVVDDHGIVRDGIRSLLRRQDGMDVVGLAATGEQAVSAAQRYTSEHVHRALRAGACGYVIKEAAGSELVCAVRTVLSGKRYLSPSIAAVFSRDSPNDSDARSPLERLSAREREVLHRTVEGLSSAQIGVQLSLSPKTIDTYRSRLMQKLGVSDRTTLIRFAIQHAMAPC
jgi:DNA-binding NarL/FixJ family response regulator